MSEKELTASDARKPRWRLRRWLWACLCVGLLALAWATPWLLKLQLQRQLQHALHRPVLVQAVDIHPFALSVEVRGVSVANGHGGELLGWDRLRVQASPQSWREKAAVLDVVQLDGLRVMATRQSDGRYDFDDLLHTQGTNESAAPRYAARVLNLHQARIAWRDGNSSSSEVLAQVDLKGHVDALTGAAKGEFDLTLSEVKLAKLQAALAIPLPMQIHQGDASAQLHIQWTKPSHEASDLHAMGQLRLADLAMQDDAGHASLAIKTLQLQLDLADFHQRMVKMSELVVDQPQLRLQLVAPTHAASSRVLGASGVVASSSPPSPDAEWQVTLDQLTLQNGSLSLQDARVRPTFHARVAALNGTVQGLSTRTETQADMLLNGTYSGSAPVTIQARLNPLAPKKFLELRAKVSNMELPRFSGYMGKYAGYAIEKGKGTMDVAYHLRNGQLTGENHVFIDQLTLGERVESPDATSLPVSLAIALLKNRQGQIELDLPVSGSVDDPQFSMGQVIGQAVLNLLGKVVASPWTLLQSVFSGGEALSQVTFAPGSVDLDEATRQTLANLARAMNERPALTLEVRGVVDAARDAAGLANQDALTALAQRRAQAVQRWLLESGKVAPELVFVLAPKTRSTDMPVNAGVVFTLR